MNSVKVDALKRAWPPLARWNPTPRKFDHVSSVVRHKTSESGGVVLADTSGETFRVTT
jgi:hypothetical protein